ncbi:hypothetical protein cypCar_00019560 [Cyprinus carpio]|nr:hypothetical protein cypCar_00019560 [Cyprinus carpio]
MGVLAMMPALLSAQNSCTPKAANIIAEVAKNEFMRSPCVEAGLIPPLVQLLNCKDQEILLQTGRALGNICYDSHEGRSAVDAAGGAQIVAEHIKSLAESTDPATGKLLTVFCGMLMNYSNDNDVIKLQLVDAGLVECLLEVVAQTVDSDRDEDVAQLKTSSDLMVLLLLGDESMQKLFEGDENCIHMVDTGIVQKLLELLDRHVEEGNVTVQHAALSALRNLAIPVVNKSKMLLAGVSDIVLKFLKSEMPPVQFKLLGTLRMLIDTQADAAEQLGTNTKLVERLVEWCEAKDHAGVMGESNRLLSALIRHSKSKNVVRTVIQGGGVKHLVTMATSEHMIMQNEALVALGLIAALDLECAEKDFVGADLVQVLHRLLTEEHSAPEIKYNSMILICSVMGSEPLHKEVQSLAFIDVVSSLRSHENKTVAHQASLTEQRLTAQS